MFEGKAPKVVKRQLAKDILRAVLDDGAIVSSERAKKIAATGGFISEATIRDARRELGVDITKRADGTEDWTLHGG